MNIVLRNVLLYMKENDHITFLVMSSKCMIDIEDKISMNHTLKHRDSDCESLDSHTSIEILENRYESIMKRGIKFHPYIPQLLRKTMNTGICWRPHEIQVG